MNETDKINETLFKYLGRGEINSVHFGISHFYINGYWFNDKTKSTKYTIPDFYSSLNDFNELLNKFKKEYYVEIEIYDNLYHTIVYEYQDDYYRKIQIADSYNIDLLASICNAIYYTILLKGK